jgi:hypothetical protein
MNNRIDLSDEEIFELINLYKAQSNELTTMRVEMNMYKEWAISYKREIEKLKLIIKDYENDFKKLIENSNCLLEKEKKEE